MAAARLDLSVQFEIKTLEGSPFFDARLNYHGLSYETVIMIENLMLDALGKMNEMAAAPSKS